MGAFFYLWLRALIKVTPNIFLKNFSSSTVFYIQPIVSPTKDTRTSTKEEKRVAEKPLPTSPHIAYTLTIMLQGRKS